MSINKVFLCGNITRNPEIRKTANGSSVLGFSIAVNDRIKNQQTGQWEDRPNFFDCVMFGPRADSIVHYMSKGMKVAIEGRLRWNQWEKDGVKRSKVDVVIDDIELMQRRSNADAVAPEFRDQQTQQVHYQSVSAGDDNAAMVASAFGSETPMVYEQDIPF